MNAIIQSNGFPCSQSTRLYRLSPAPPPPQATNEVVGRVPKATQEEMLAAVDSCSRAYQSWSETSILSRQQIFLRYQQLIKDNIVRESVSCSFESVEDNDWLIVSSFTHVLAFSAPAVLIFRFIFVF